ncbi:hypothetical protein RJT34_10776 [Clitoria ternatea]|uniref:Uncharacterized protein n=1 Tax=Clitoria ternatea TaxID=43366 RepID=A0AAN9PHU6_CLITE
MVGILHCSKGIGGLLTEISVCHIFLYLVFLVTSLIRFVDDDDDNEEEWMNCSVNLLCVSLLRRVYLEEAVYRALKKMCEETEVFFVFLIKLAFSLCSLLLTFCPFPDTTPSPVHREFGYPSSSAIFPFVFQSLSLPKPHIPT